VPRQDSFHELQYYKIRSSKEILQGFYNLCMFQCSRRYAMKKDDQTEFGRQDGTGRLYMLNKKGH